MPPKQASLHAFFGGERTPKRPRTDKNDDDKKDIRCETLQTASPPPRSTQKPPAPAKKDRDNLLTAHRFDPNDSSEREIKARASFLHIVKPNAPSGPVKYTPLELQILQLKKEHPGVLLLVEVGYKMKFYQEDARIASQLLNIVR